MNHVLRQRWVALCLLFCAATGFSASAQTVFLDASIISADPVTDEMKQKITALVDPAIAKLLSGEATQVKEARATLTTPPRDNSATQVFKEAYSSIISSRLKDAVAHEKPLVRINALIVCAELVDKTTMQLIDAGLKDKNPAVQRKAIEAIRKRVQNILRLGGDDQANQAAIAAAVKQVNAHLDQSPGPHPITVTPALQIFLDINTSDSLLLIGDHLNKRVALHAADPNLPCYAEQLAVDRLTKILFKVRNPKLAIAVSRASWRYASLIVGQLKAGAINEDQLTYATNMLGQSLLSLGNVAAVMNANVPAAHNEFNNLVKAQEWDKLASLLKDQWVPVLTAAPFGLTEADLKLK